MYPRAARDPIRADLANVSLSDKKVKLQPNHSDVDKKLIVFPNQLLQIPGITEKVALSITERFPSPADLIEHLKLGKSLEDLTFVNSKRETKK